MSAAKTYTYQDFQANSSCNISLPKKISFNNIDIVPGTYYGSKHRKGKEMGRNKYKPLTIHPPTIVLEQIKAFAAENETSMTAVVLQALESFLAQQQGAKHE